MTSNLPDKYINPLTDFGFKKLFGSEPNKDLLIDFLNLFLPPKHTIKDLTYTKNEHLGETLLDRKAIFDIYCESFTLKFIYLELPKFQKTEKELESHFDKWLFVFRHLAELQKRPKALQERIFEKLFEAAEIAKFTPSEREAYQSSLKYYRDIKNVVDTSKEEGLKEGEEIGIQKGLKQGLKQVAKNMKQEGMSASTITQLTGLSSQKIEEL